MDDNGSRVHAFLRFDDIIGNGLGQIPPGATIASAKLVFNATSSTKGKVIMHRMLVPWAEYSAWMDFTPVDALGQPAWTSMTYLNTDTGIYLWQTLANVMVGGGVQADNVEAMSEVDTTFVMQKAYSKQMPVARLHDRPPAAADDTAWRIGPLCRKPARGASKRVGCGSPVYNFTGWHRLSRAWAVRPQIWQTNAGSATRSL
jgi:hypothetical protein